MNTMIRKLLTWLCGLLVLDRLTATEPDSPGHHNKLETVCVMSFNLWHGGDAGNQPLDQTVAVIKAGQADIVGLQETEGLAAQNQPRPDNGRKLAE